MNYPVELLEQIDRYLAGELPDVERRAIERQMEVDHAFRETVLAMQHTHQFLEEASLLHKARKVLDQLDQEATIQPTVPVRSIGNRRSGWLVSTLMAASVVIASGVFLTYSSVDLANADISPQVHRAALATPTETLLPVEKQALNDFISANGYFINGDYKSAISFYERTATAPVSDYLRECTWWNLSLAYLKKGDIQQARKYFNQYKSVSKPHYQTGYFDQLKLSVQLFWADIID